MRAVSARPSARRTAARSGGASTPATAVAASSVAFPESCKPANIAARIDEGVRVIAGHNPETAKVGRAHQKRAMPV